MPLLVLADLSGLVRNSHNKPSVENIRSTEALSDRYMESPRAITLNVVAGGQLSLCVGAYLDQGAEFQYQRDTLSRGFKKARIGEVHQT